MSGVTKLGYGYVLNATRGDLGKAGVKDLGRSYIERTIRSRRDRGLSHRSIVNTLEALDHDLTAR